MMNLKDLGKKLFSNKIFSSKVIHISLITIVIILVLGLYRVAGKKENHDHSVLLEQYHNKLDSVLQINIRLERRQLVILENLDSLYNLKQNLTNEENEVITSIYSANANDHGRWFCTKLDSLKEHSILRDYKGK